MPKQIWYLPLLPPSKQHSAQCAAGVYSARQCQVLSYQPPGWRAVLGWVNPATSHRMSVSAEFCSLGPIWGMHLNAHKYCYISQALPVQTGVICTSSIVGIYCRKLPACSGLVWSQFTSVGFVKVVTPVCEVSKVRVDSLQSPQNKDMFLQPTVAWTRQFDMGPRHGRSKQCLVFENRNSNKPLPFLPSQFTGKIFWLVWRLELFFFLPV